MIEHDLRRSGLLPSEYDEESWFLDYDRSQGVLFLNVSMANRLDGLRQVASKAGIALKEMEAGDYLIFVNRDRDKVVLLAGQQLVRPIGRYGLYEAR